MARKGNKKEKKDYKEFEFPGKEFKYSGRVYPDSTKTAGKVDITNMSLCLNGVITIKYCKLMQSDNSTWISFPQYKDKNDDYQDYFFIEKEFSKEELSVLAEIIEKLLDEDD